MDQIDPPGSRPKKPVRPRRPREFHRRTEVIWTSEDDDILLSDLLPLIPGDVKAENVRVGVERHPMTDQPFVVITYDRETPNLRFADQLRLFEAREVRYDVELQDWVRRDAEWQSQRDRYESEISRLQLEIERAFEEHELGQVVL